MSVMIPALLPINNVAEQRYIYQIAGDIYQSTQTPFGSNVTDQKA